MNDYLNWLPVLLFLALPAHSQESQFAAISSWETPYATELRSAGVVPTQVVDCAGAQIYLSSPYELDDMRQVAVAWVEAGSEKAVRALYRSNSQCCWRMVDAMTPTHIGKGYHEFDKNMPIDVTVALLRASKQLGTLRPWKPGEQAQANQTELSQQLLEMLTINRDEGMKSGRVLRVGDMYVTKEYASWMPLMPQPFSIVQARIQTPTGSEVADPAKTQLPAERFLPDFGVMPTTVKFQVPAYARFTQTDGELTGEVFPSRNGNARYFFVRDSLDRVFLSCVENTEAPVCSLGLRTRYYDVEGMDTPLIEYSFQIPELYGGKKQSRYQLNWNWVRTLPIIQHYYAARGIAVPEPTKNDRKP